MCGILFLKSLLQDSQKERTSCSDQKKSSSLDLIKHRGPDSTSTMQLGDKFFGFVRLAIVGLDSVSDQPLCTERCVLICNGEIYNFKSLVKEFHLESLYQSHSDCEVIIHLYESLGIEKTLSLLEGEFAFVLYDSLSDTIIAARDHIGIRPLFFGKSLDGYAYSSELKALHPMCTTIEQFPAHSWQIDGGEVVRYEVETPVKDSSVKELLVGAVKARLQSDRKIGVFLSGGLDSSLVCAIAARELGTIDTFSIGTKGSPDLLAARKVADFLKTNHTEIHFTPEQGIQTLEKLIWHLETFDTTTIRASLPMFLLSKEIKDRGIAVVLSGEGADELFAGYLYSHYAPSSEDLQLDLKRLVRNLPYFDVLRGDRSTAAWGLELRVPFLERGLVEKVMGLEGEVKDPKKNKGIEKFLLRKEFEGWLPDEILWRRKEAFSDGCGHDWISSVKSFCEKQISDEEFSTRREKFSYLTPRTKEEFYYRTIFESHFPGREKILPEFWMPKWSNTTDPSARTLEIYDEKKLQDGPCTK